MRRFLILSVFCLSFSSVAIAAESTDTSNLSAPASSAKVSDDPCRGTLERGSLEEQACECNRFPAMAKDPRCIKLQKYMACMADQKGEAAPQTDCKCTTGLQTTGCK